MKRIAACVVVVALASACGTTSARIQIKTPSAPQPVGKPIEIVANWDGRCFVYELIPFTAFVILTFPISWTLFVDWDNAKDSPGLSFDNVGIPTTEVCNHQPFRIDVTCSIGCETLVGAGIGRATTRVIPLEPGVLRLTVVATHTEQVLRRYEAATEIVVVPNGPALQSATPSPAATSN